MFTSRAEYRLLLNHGSAELRLSERAGALGLIDDQRLKRILEKRRGVEYWESWLETNRVGESSWAESIRRGEKALPPELLSESAPVRDEVLYRVAFQGYIQRQQREVEKILARLAL